MIDCRLSEHGEIDVAKTFFQEALQLALESTDRVTQIESLRTSGRSRESLEVQYYIEEIDT